MSRSKPRRIHIQSQPAMPTPGLQARRYIIVVYGRNIIPSKGQIHVSQTRSHLSLNNQARISTSLGAKAAVNAIKHPKRNILHSPHNVR
jgi:hypothetical protein